MTMAMFFANCYQARWHHL